MGNIYKTCKVVSTRDISEDVVYVTKGDKAVPSYRDKVHTIISRAVESSKWCTNEIYEELNKEGKDISMSKLENLFSYKPKVVNLLSGKSRTHSVMQIYSDAPCIDFEDEVLLDIFEDDIKYEYYLEERASFSIDDVLEYIHTYYDRHLLLQVNDNKKITGVIKYALANLKDINIVMFMIDAMFKEHKEKETKVVNFIEVMNYAHIGIERHKGIVDRINTGDLKFVDRRR